LTQAVPEPVAMHGPLRLAHSFGLKMPHAWPVGQPPAFVPQMCEPPQPSGAYPQVIVPQACGCVFGVHWLPPPQTFAAPPPPQTVGEGQVAPHWTVPPQPSAMNPHPFDGQLVIVFAMHGPPPAPPSAVIPPPPQTFAVPEPPQIAGPVHAPPHVTSPPHPSAMLPQFDPAGHWVSFGQTGAPHWFATPRPPQICPPVQVAPQSRTPPQSSAIFPH